jgi:CrcB protein
MIPFLIAVGGALGCVARYGIGRLIQPHGAGAFPWATLLINIAGSICLGFIYRYFDFAAAPQVRAFAGIGFCGGFTTFSTFSYDAVGLLQAGDYARASVYIVASVGCCLIGTICGIMLGAAVLRA